jgi:hypothetical protein
MSEKRRGPLRRAADYGLRRLGAQPDEYEIDHTPDGEERIRIRRGPLGVVRAIRRDAFSRLGLRPQAWDSRGFRGRYEDGGVAAFREQAEKAGFCNAELELQAGRWRQQAAIYLAGAAAVLAMAFLVALGGGLMDLVLAFGMLCVTAMLLGMALAADFSRWRIDMRRMGGFAEYLDQAPRAFARPALPISGDEAYHAKN